MSQTTVYHQPTHLYSFLYLSIRHTLTLLLFSFFCSISTASEQEVFKSLNDIGSGSLVSRGKNGLQNLTRLTSDIDLSVSGLVVQAKVSQHFRNQSNQWIEATYVFPLPSNSSVNKMQIKIGDRMIKGMIKERNQAKQIFTQAKQQGKQAGLLEQQRANLFTTQVANIGPGETIEVAFQYLQTLDYNQGKFSLRVPLTLTPRYIPSDKTSNKEGSITERNAINEDVTSPELTAGTRSLNSPAPLNFSQQGWALPTTEVPDAHKITPPQIHRPTDQHSHRATLSVTLNPGFDIAEVNAALHDISTVKQGNHYRITPKHNPVLMNRDFVLSWQPVVGQTPQGALFVESLTPETENQEVETSENRRDSKTGKHNQEQHHALIMVLPPEQTQQAQILPRELWVILDTSGSMAGTSLEQAKNAVLMALDRLRPDDRFNLVEFNSTHRTLFTDAVRAEPHHVNQAKQFVHALQANGGTEMAGALKTVLQHPKTTSYLKQVVFMTDGSVGNEHDLLTLIHRHIDDSRLFTIGIGSSPNDFFIRKAAEMGRGKFAMINHQDQVDQEITALFDQIEQPILTDISINTDENVAVYPTKIPDIYAGQPIVLNARFSTWPSEFTLIGNQGGKPWQQTLSLGSQTSGSNPSPGVATLWARKKVQALEDSGTRSGNRNLHEAEILQLGLDYSMVTRFTSFVAVSEEITRKPNERLASKSIPNLMPAGSKQQAPSVGLPNTAIGIPFQLASGTLLLALAIMLSGRRFNLNKSK